MRSYGKAYSQTKNPFFPKMPAHVQYSLCTEREMISITGNIGKTERWADKCRQGRLSSKRYSLPWKFSQWPISIVIHHWITDEFSLIYHQNLQMSMKQEALAHLLSQLSGRLSHCKARWNNSRSMCCNKLEMHQPHEHAILKMMPTVKIFFCSV